MVDGSMDEQRRPSLTPTDEADGDGSLNERRKPLCRYLILKMVGTEANIRTDKGKDNPTTNEIGTVT